MKKTYGLFAVVVCLGIGTALFTKCGKDNVTNVYGGHDTLSIFTHDTLRIYSRDTILTSSYDTVLVITQDSTTSYDTVTIYTYDTVRIYYTDSTGYVLTPTATAGGTIYPSVPVKVDSGDFRTFIAKPDFFYVLDSVTAEGVRLQVSAGPLGSTVYVFNVTKDMVVKAWFSLRQIYYGMKQIPGGTFLMGVDSIYQTAGIMNTFYDTIHWVTLSAFYMDTTEVTQAEYRGLMGVNPSYFHDSAGWASRPVENVTWFDAALYCNARSKSEGRDTVYSYICHEALPWAGPAWVSDITIDYAKNGYRLPTEAEWEYACRGGTTTNYWWGNDTSGMGARAWTYYNSGNTTHTVATRLANAYGLYDMTGNVWEFCNDWSDYYYSSSQTDPTGPSTGSYHVVRGGGWTYCHYWDTFSELRSAYRTNDYDMYSCSGAPDGSYVGFRCVRR